MIAALCHMYSLSWAAWGVPQPGHVSPRSRATALPLQSALLDNPRLVEKLDGCRRTQVGILPRRECPDNLLLPRHLEDLDGAGPLFRLIVSRAPVGDHRIAICPPHRGLRIEELDIGNVGLGKFPDRLRSEERR